MNAIFLQDPLAQSQYAQFSLGQQGVDARGRVWVYGQATEATTKGHCLRAAADVDADLVSSPVDSNGNYTRIYYSTGGWTAGAYEGDWAFINDGTGEGQAAPIVGNSVDTLHLDQAYALGTALAVADSDLTIHRPFHWRKTAASMFKQLCLGFAQVAFTSDYYGWVLKEGIGVAVAGEALTAGTPITSGDDTAGQVELVDSGDDLFDVVIVGHSLVAGATADTQCFIRANID